ncbi:MAG: hypothetical protein JO223_03820 [Hyphomicrobiales bacterium]|nr:hypothetical protein [Hyphomicrobiales bacterium]
MFWQTVLSSKGAMAVALGIESSTEYRSQLIAQLYQTDLDRLPSPTEVYTFLGLLTGARPMSS